VLQPVEIEFFKPERRRYRSVLHRRDGLVIELDGGGYNKVGGPARELPHDLAHFVVEDGPGLEAGLWGVLAAGGMFGHAKVIAGRRKPHFAERSQAVVDAAGGRLAQAEMLTRSVCDLALEGADSDVRRLKAATGDGWWRDTTAEQIAATCRSLRETSVRWRDLRAGEALKVLWRLPPPPTRAGSPAPRRRSARGRA
jgi:hypothetical protein